MKSLNYCVFCGYNIDDCKNNFKCCGNFFRDMCVRVEKLEKYIFNDFTGVNPQNNRSIYLEQRLNVKSLEIDSLKNVIKNLKSENTSKNLEIHKLRHEIEWLKNSVREYRTRHTPFQQEGIARVST